MMLSASSRALLDDFLRLELRRIKMFCLTAFLAALQVPFRADFSVQIGLQCGKRLSVKQLLRAQPAARNGNQIQVQVRRGFVHVDDGRNDIALAVVLREEAGALGKELLLLARR